MYVFFVDYRLQNEEMSLSQLGAKVFGVLV